MNSLINKFEQNLPEWTDEIKNESHKKIRSSQLILDCREFNRGAMKTLMIRFYPFVHIFPKIIELQKERILKREKWRHPFSIRQLGGRCGEILSEIGRDEESHRKLWLNTSLALGLSEEDLHVKQFYQNPKARFRVQKIIDIVGAKADSSTTLLRFAAIEIIAESISHELIIIFSDLDAEVVKRVENGESEFANLKPSQWFQVHVYHKEGVMSHEELVYRMVFAFDGKTPEKDRANKVIQEIVDLFIEAGKAPY